MQPIYGHKIYKKSVFSQNMESLLSYNDSDRTDEESKGSEDVDSEDFDKEELEIALYSQIHFETNEDLETEEIPEKDEISDNFVIDVKGNDKTGFLSELTTADYIVNKCINAESNTEVKGHIVNSKDFNGNKTALTEDRKTGGKRKPKYFDNIRPDKISVIENALHRIQNRKNRQEQESKSFAENFILDTRSSSESDKSDDSSDLSESNSDDELIDIDIESEEESSDIYVNVEKNQQSLVTKTASEEWNIDVNDIPRYNSNFLRSRYYKPISVCCRNCDQMGHLSKNCPKPKKEQICVFCSETGHLARSCPDAFCYNCEAPGHIAKECSYPKRSWYKGCTRCRMQGHSRLKCPDQWRQYHLTISGNELIRGKKRKLLKKTCYNCTADDHLGHECEEARMDKYSQPSNPFICKYIPLEYDYYSRDATEYLGPTKNDTLLDKDREKKRLSQFIRNKPQPESTGRNNFDKLQFSPNIVAKFSERSKSGFNISEKLKQRIGRTDISVGSSKRKVTFDSDDKAKKQKILNSEAPHKEKFSHKDVEKSVKSNKKGSKSQKAENAERSNVETQSRVVTSKDRMKAQREFAKEKKVKETTKTESEISDKHVRTISEVHKPLSKKKEVRKESFPKTGSYYDEIEVTFANREENFSRGGTAKPDSFCGEIHVTFANKQCASPGAGLDDKGKIKKVTNSNISDSAEDDHQVFHNEWWNKKAKGKKKKKKNKGTRNTL